jgi:hypothetical protein
MMNTLISKTLDVFKSLRIERALVIILAGVLVLVTTACNPNSPSAVGTGSYNERIGQPQGLHEFTDRPDGKSRPDLSSYRDNDARDTNAARTKARDLSRRADQNVGKVQSPQDFAESYREGAPINERVRNLSEDVGGAAQQFGEDFSKGAQENLRNLKGNVDKAGRNIQQTAERAQQNS